MRIEERWCGRVMVMEKQDWAKHYHMKNKELVDSLCGINLDKYIPAHVKHIVLNVEKPRLTDARLGDIMWFIATNTDSFKEAYDITTSIMCEHKYEPGTFEEIFLKHRALVREGK